jgi:hypothetical protein
MPRQSTNPPVERTCEVCGTKFMATAWDVSRGYGRACSRKCGGVIRRGARLTLEERFWRYVDKNGPIPPHRPELGPCWLWTGALNGDTKWRYGVLGKTTCTDGAVLAHRVSYELHVGKIPDGILVCHHCDNPPCCNPTHLFLGGYVENAKDMVEKGRHPFVGNLDIDRKGEANPYSKLTEDIVREIRRRKALGENRREVHKDFAEIKFSTFCSVWDSRSWKHVV